MWDTKPRNGSTGMQSGRFEKSQQVALRRCKKAFIVQQDRCRLLAYSGERQLPQARAEARRAKTGLQLSSGD